MTDDVRPQHPDNDPQPGVSTHWSRGEVVRRPTARRKYIIAAAIVGVVAACVAVAVVAVSGAWSFQVSAGIDSPATTQTTSPADSGQTPVCILNASIHHDLALMYLETLTSAGVPVNEVGDFLRTSITTNTVFYNRPEQKQQAHDIASVVEASVEPRPATLARCRGKLAVVVVD